MRASKYFFITTREDPADADLISHKLMIRSGMIRKVSGGIYNWLPMGLRVVRKIEKIVREEMNKIGAIEIFMPIVQPAELWETSGRWDKYGPLLFKLQDRNSRKFCLGPTHEEVITEMVGNILSSYKQLPINLYQIQVKLRDEIRPRFGIMRGREFIMKDAYSFHSSIECLQKTYDQVYSAYCQMFSRMGLEYRAVAADSGAIGGNFSHEFQVIADSGEDQIAFCDNSDYAANIELCALPPINSELPKPTKKQELVKTPSMPTCIEVAKFLGLDIQQILKTLVIKTDKNKFVMVLLRGDFELNLYKLQQFLDVDEVSFIEEDEVKKLFNTSFGYLGPINAPKNIEIIADYSVKLMADFACGANIEDHHYQGNNWEVDIPLPKLTDLRFAVDGDDSPDGKGKLVIKRGIEVGHVFQLGNKYSKKMNALYQDQNGNQLPFEMGCYGIGITRIVGAAIEQNHDQNGIIFPIAIAPFQVYLVPIGYHKSPELSAEVDKIYRNLIENGIEVYLDDRNERPGVMFSDHELSGIPFRLIISEKNLADQKAELICRKTKKVEILAYDEILPAILKLIKLNKNIIV